MLTLSLGMQHRHLQPEVQQMIELHNGCKTSTSRDLWRCPPTNATAPQASAATRTFTAANAQLDTPGAGLSILDAVRGNKYTLVYCGVGGHWVALMFHATTAGRTTTIHQAVIADPLRKVGLRVLLWQRLRAIFTRARGFEFAQTAPQALWYPQQNDNYSCGLRVYEILKTMMQRINEEQIRDPRAVVYNDSCEYLPPSS